MKTVLQKQGLVNPSLAITILIENHLSVIAKYRRWIVLNFYEIPFSFTEGYHWITTSTLRIYTNDLNVP